MKCRFCKYEVPNFYTNKDGERKSGFTRLNNHLLTKHSEEWEALQAALGPRDEELTSPSTDSD